jgi:hypothetical protein
MMKNEFTFFGVNMEGISVIYGICLLTWGFLITFISDSTSITSLIPSMFGVPILILSILAIWVPERKKTFNAFCCFIWAIDIFWWARLL